MRGVIIIFILVLGNSCSVSKKIKEKDSPVFKVIIEASYDLNKLNQVSREVALNKRLQRANFYNSEGKLIEYHLLELTGEVYEITKLDMVETSHLRKSVTYNYNGKVKKYWLSTINTDGNVTEVRTYNSNDELLSIQTNKYDSQGNKKEMILGNPNNANADTTIYLYNSQNQLTEKLLYSSNQYIIRKRTYEYDNKGNRKRVTSLNPDGSLAEVVFEYDEMNNLVSQWWVYEKRRKGSEISFVYIYDENGNWITKKRTNSGELNYIWERKIEYY